MNTDEQRAKHAAYMREWGAKNRDKARASGRAAYYRDHERRKQHLRDYQKTHKAEQNRRHRERMARDPEYREQHRKLCRYHRARGRVQRKDGIVALFEAEVRAVYFACPPGMEVDHIHPLRIMVGKEHVGCGLHVPWNLQYLTARENKRKGRKVDGVPEVRLTEEELAARKARKYAYHRAWRAKQRRTM
jgi:hypothetical protein